MKKYFGKSISLLLVLMLVLGMLPTAALADGDSIELTEAEADFSVLNLKLGQVPTPGKLTAPAGVNYTLSAEVTDSEGNAITSALVADTNYRVTVRAVANDGYTFANRARLIHKNVPELDWGATNFAGAGSSIQFSGYFGFFTATGEEEDPSDEPKDDPKEDPKDDSKDDSKEDPKDDPADKPAVDPKEDPKDDSTDKPAVDPKDDSKEDPKDDSTDKPAVDPKENPKDDSKDDSTDKPVVDPQDDTPTGTSIPSVTLDGSGILPSKGAISKFLTAPADASYTITDQSWWDASGADVTTFASAGNYVFNITLTAKEGYYFPEDATLEVTGIDWDSRKSSPYSVVNGELHFSSVYNLKEETEPTDPVVTVSYTMLDGKNQEVAVNTDSAATFRSNASYDKFKEVRVDGKLVDPSNYTVKEGSTIVTLKPIYLKALSVGKHTMAIVSTDGSATTDFTVTDGKSSDSKKDDSKKSDDSKKKDDSKKSTKTKTKATKKTTAKAKTQYKGSIATGDSSNAIVWGIVMLIACALAAVLVLNKRKHTN